VSDTLWTPRESETAATAVAAFQQRINQQEQQSITSFQELHAWSVAEPESFWLHLWQFADIEAQHGPGKTVLENGHAMPGANWFPDTTLNFAWNLLKYDAAPEADALVFRGESGLAGTRRTSWAQLRREVLILARWMQHQGIESGDRVVGFLPNIPEAVVAMLATTALGAVWSSGSPDFGLNGVLDRFGQIQPKMLFTADGYYYNGKVHDSLALVDELASAIPDIEQIVVIDYLHGADERASTLAGGRPVVALTGILNAQNTASAAPNDAETLHALKGLCVATPFNHPLFIMFSSGTTGKPKCIVHSVGGGLLQLVKEHRLHVDVRAGEKLFFFTTCGWMMWNWLVAALASGATVMLYDGSPFYPNGNTLFDYAQDEGFHHFGTSAKFIDACNKANLSPRTTHDLSSLRSVLSTGSPLIPESFDYVYEHISSDVCLSSMSGGTDILSCFVLGSPTLAVKRGELQCLALGLDVQVFTDDAQVAAVHEKGELVCVAPFPSMPIGFWNDSDGARYHAAYFDRFDNVWCHGDYVAMTESGGMVIYGRSDAVLNPGGVRIGTAEIYRQVEQFDEVVEAIVVGQRWQGDVRVVLFLRLRDGVVLDDALRASICGHIRTQCTPRHVPAKLIAVTDIPRTRSGKIVELAVRNLVHGKSVDNVEALANPEALALFSDLPELQS